MGTTKFSSISPVDHELHWLLVQARIHFKIVLLAFNPFMVLYLHLVFH